VLSGPGQSKAGGTLFLHDSFALDRRKAAGSAVAPARVVEVGDPGRDADACLGAGGEGVQPDAVPDAGVTAPIFFVVSADLRSIITWAT
jgi:hypothetical protein